MCVNDVLTYRRSEEMSPEMFLGIDWPKSPNDIGLLLDNDYTKSSTYTCDDYTKSNGKTSWRHAQTIVGPMALGGMQDVIIWEGATGSGKSLVPAAVAKLGSKKVTVLTATRDLQQQYETLGADALWGRSHYECVSPHKIVEHRQNGYAPPTADDCPYSSPAQECKVYMSCPYIKQRNRTIERPFVVVNYAYWWFAEWWRTNRLKNGGLYVFDECHRLEDIATSLVTLSVSERRRREWQLQEFPSRLDGSSELTLIRTKKWIEGALSDLKDSQEVVQYLIKPDDNEPLEVNHKLERLVKTLTYLRGMLENAKSGDFFAKVDPVDGIEVKPTDPTPHIWERFVAPVHKAGSKMLFMSATIGDPETFVRDTLSLESGTSLVAVASPHIVAPEDRPVLLVKDAVSMGRSTSEKDEVLQMNMVADTIKMFRQHSDAVVLVHCAAWWQVNKLVDVLRKRKIQGVVRHPDKMGRVKGVEWMKKRGKGSVLVSPSLWEGFDPLPENSPGMVIVAKVPWPSLGDPVNKIKLKREGGNKWYCGQASRQMVQGSGRGSRRLGDRCIIVILDKNAGRVLSTAQPPLWFSDAVEKIEWKDVGERIGEFCNGGEVA